MNDIDYVIYNIYIYIILNLNTTTMEDNFDHGMVDVEKEFLNIKNNINMVKTVHIYNSFT